MTDSKIYIGITIGPIYKTMTMARKTREFWGASFLFSKLSQAISLELRQRLKDQDFIIPTANIFNHDMMDYGLHLDRIIISGDRKLWDDIPDIVDKAFNDLAIETTMVEADLTSEVLKGYFKVYSTYVEAKGANILSEISQRLNEMEMYNKISSSFQYDSIIKSFMDNVNTKYKDAETFEDSSFLKKYFDQKDFSGNVRIPSIVEVATKALGKSASDAYKRVLKEHIWKRKDRDQEIISGLREMFKDDLRNHYKYIAILQADGDKLGKYLMSANAETVNEVSSNLIEWGHSVYKILKEYGALPIYIGGDDVMCFAPVNTGTDNILDLASALNASFKALPFCSKANASLSVGVKICYYKSPMGENYADTFPLLRGDAKQYKIIHKVDGNEKGIEANACAIQFDKHSGQPHKIVFNFEHEYEQFVKPILDAMTILDDKKSFLNSVGYFVRANEALIFTIYQDADRFWHLFENNFTEAKIDKANTSEYKFIKVLSEYLRYLCLKYKKEKISNYDEYVATTTLYSTIKIVKLIKGLDQDHE